MSFVPAYRALSPASRLLCAVSWIYKSLERYISIFAGASLYLSTGSVEWVLVYAASLAGATCLGYSGGYWLLAGRGIGSRTIFALSFVCIVAGFTVMLAIPGEVAQSLVFGICYGLCHGLYYLGNHWNMLQHTADADRDGYVTVQSSGALAIDILVPLLATAVFAVSAHLGWRDEFVLALTLMWALSALGFWYSVRYFTDTDALPRPRLANVLAMLRHPNFPRSAVFFSVLRMDMSLNNGLMPILAVMVLGGAVELGASATVVSVFSIAFILWSHRYRSPATRARFARIGFALEIAAYIAAIVSVAAVAPIPAAYFACVLVLPFARSISGPVTGLYELRAAELLTDTGS